MSEEIFIIYEDENKQEFSGYVSLIRQTDTYITFSTSNNEITIPIHRLIKIKKKVVGRSE